MVIGTLIGVAGALLLAPDSGRETRRRLARRGRLIGKRAADAWNDLGIELKRAKGLLRRRRRAVVAEVVEPDD